jgi:hypothetical protein
MFDVEASKLLRTCLSLVSVPKIAFVLTLTLIGVLTVGTESVAYGATCLAGARPEFEVVRASDGRLRVSVLARPSVDGNRIRALRFLDPRNAVIDIINGPFSQNRAFTYSPSGGMEFVEFAVGRATASGPVHVPYVIVEDCGEWKTFVGGGTDVAFAPPRAPLPALVAPVSFVAAPGVPPEDRQLVEHGIALGDRYFLSTLQVTVQRPTLIRMVTAPESTNPCSANDHTITFTVTAASCWSTQPPKWKVKIAAHEYFHVLQYELATSGGANNAAKWVLEGSAELFGYRSVIANGLLSEEQVLNCQLARLRSNPQTPPLRGLEASVSTPGLPYSLSHLAMERLVARSGPMAVRHHFELLRTTNWQAAFQAAFGVDKETFYQQFDQHLTSLPTPEFAPNCNA